MTPMDACAKVGIDISPVSKFATRHWMLQVNSKYVYVELSAGYPFVAPIVAFATKFKKSEKQIEEKSYKVVEYLRNWEATFSIFLFQF